FFFSSRRRHTRSDRDWSSDVCSSDLGGEGGRLSQERAAGGMGIETANHNASSYIFLGYSVAHETDRGSAVVDRREGRSGSGRQEIGRASCRERGECAATGGGCKKNNK